MSAPALFTVAPFIKGIDRRIAQVDVELAYDLEECEWFPDVVRCVDAAGRPVHLLLRTQARIAERVWDAVRDMTPNPEGRFRWRAPGHGDGPSIIRVPQEATA